MTDSDGSRIHLDARSLRGLAHPVRLKVLGRLREGGPSTATALAAELGESSGVTSYHLRQLAQYGFVVEDDTPRASRRERWWRAAHRTTVLETHVSDDVETTMLVDEYLRSVAGAYAVIRQRGETIIGVAIATALMPPVATVGFTTAVRTSAATPAL